MYLAFGFVFIIGIVYFGQVTGLHPKPTVAVFLYDIAWLFCMIGAVYCFFR